MKASFIILNYNRKEDVLLTISKTRELIKDKVSDFEIVVVDNASADGSAEEISKQFPEVVLIARDANDGISGWNEGFKIARGEYLIVLDDDSHIESGLDESLAYMDKNSGVGILALNISGGFVRQEDYYRGLAEDDNLLDEKELVTFIGCGAIIRKKLYDEIGGFADWLKIYAHEWEYGIRCIEAGYKIRFFKNSRVVHRVSTINRTVKRTVAFATRNEMMIINKYFKHQRAKFVRRVFFNHLRWRLVNQGVKAAYYTIVGGYQFSQLKRNLSYTPVSAETQSYFTEKFVSTRPFFSFLQRWQKTYLNK